MKIVSYNIQAGIGSRHYGDYIMGAHKQLIHSPKKKKTLLNIGNFISDIDIICLQEIDLGGRRNRFQCQADELLSISEHEFSAHQVNRFVRKISQHGNAIFSKYPMDDVQDHKLPSRVPGRGVLICATGGLTIVNTHLSLGIDDQKRQLEFIAKLVEDRKNKVIVGDMNCTADAPHLEAFADSLNLEILTSSKTKSYPAWKPKKDLDHVLVSEKFKNFKVKVKDIRLSDHLPLVIETGFKTS